MKEPREDDNDDEKIENVESQFGKDNIACTEDINSVEKISSPSPEAELSDSMNSFMSPTGVDAITMDKVTDIIVFHMSRDLYLDVHTIEEQADVGDVIEKPKP